MRMEIKTLVLAEFLVALSLGVLGPFYAIYVENITKNSATIGYSYAAFWISVGILSPVLGKLSDRYNKKIFLILGGVLAFFTSIMYNFVTSLLQLIIVEIINGFATAAFTPVYKSLTAELTSQKQRGAEYGIIDSVSSLTYGIAAVIGTFIISLVGIKILFLFSGAFQLFSSFFIAGRAKKVL